MKRRLTNRMGWMWVIGLVVVCVAFARFVVTDDASTDAPTDANDPESSVSVSVSSASQAAPQGGSQEAVAAASNFDVNSYLTTGGEVPQSTADEPSGAFRTLCTFSHLAYDDPIVYPSQPGKSHLHMFFGNTSADADSTYESLRASGGGSCQGGPINRTGYWAPAMFDAAGKVVVPDDFIVYYKGEYADAAGITSIAELPPGLRMVAGYNMETGSPDTHFEWYCEVNQVKQQSIPHCADGERVGVQLHFPQCWDGANLDSADHRSHLAHISYDTGVAACPAGYPVHIPEITLAIWWTQDGDSEAWYLSSDHMIGMTHANGSTFHSDWFGAWDPTIQNRWLNECIRAMRSCIDGELGDGSKLAQLDAYKGPMLLDPPPLPS